MSNNIHNLVSGCSVLEATLQLHSYVVTVRRCVHTHIHTQTHRGHKIYRGGDCMRKRDSVRVPDRGLLLFLDCHLECVQVHL